MSLNLHSEAVHKSSKDQTNLCIYQGRKHMIKVIGSRFYFNHNPCMSLMNRSSTYHRDRCRNIIRWNKVFKWGSIRTVQIKFWRFYFRDNLCTVCLWGRNTWGRNTQCIRISSKTCPYPIHINSSWSSCCRLFLPNNLSIIFFLC